MKNFYQHIEQLKSLLKRNQENSLEKLDLSEMTLENNVKHQHEEMQTENIQQMAEKYKPIIEEPEVAEEDTDFEMIYKTLFNKEEYLKLIPSPESSEEQLIFNNGLPDEDEFKLILIKAKNVLIYLIDKEIEKCSIKNGDNKIGEVGAGGDIGDTCKINKLKIKQLKKKRSKSIATIKREIEKLENLDFE